MSRSHPFIWYVFENAITYNGWDSKKQKRISLKRLRQKSRQLPDTHILTDGFIAMRLFIDYGIDTFSLRTTKVGAVVQIIARKMRGR